MNICFLSWLPIKPNKGGIERVTYILAKEFRKAGNNVFYISTTPDPETGVTTDMPGLQQYCLDPNSDSFNDDFIKIILSNKTDVIINQFMTPESFRLLDSLKKKRDPQPPVIINVLHNRPFYTAGLGKIFKKLTYPTTLKGKILKIIGTVAPSFYAAQRIKDDKTRLTNFITLSDRFFLLSDSFIPRLLSFLPRIDADKIDAVNNPNTFAIDSNSTEKENLMIFVGRLEDPQKNVKGFIDVWEKFHQRNPSWNAVIVGDGPHRKIFEGYAARKRVAHLEFAGNCANVKDYYQRAKLLCMPSIYEGWGMVLTEAMANECVPAAFDCYESVHDIIIDGKTGILTKPFDTDQMASRLSELANNEPLRKEIALKGAEHINTFDATKIAAIWLDKLHHLLEKHGNMSREDSVTAER